ncbi:MAG: hypothetical protein NVS1B14_08510 [Vulcanimicrobiaceae bacterium]
MARRYAADSLDVADALLASAGFDSDFVSDFVSELDSDLGSDDLRESLI